MVLSVFPILSPSCLCVSDGASNNLDGCSICFQFFCTSFWKGSLPANSDPYFLFSVGAKELE